MSTPPARAATRPAPGALPVRTRRQRPGPATRTMSLLLGAVATAPGCAPITLTITAGQAELTIRVSDPDPQPPPPGPAGPGTWDENGRGLIIVTALSHQWGTAPAPGGGKYVWATLRTDAPLPGLAPRKRPIPHARH